MPDRIKASIGTLLGILSKVPQEMLFDHRRIFSDPRDPRAKTAFNAGHAAIREGRSEAVQRGLPTVCEQVTQCVLPACRLHLMHGPSPCMAHACAEKWPHHVDEA